MTTNFNTAVMLDLVHSLKRAYLIQGEAREITHLEVGIIVYLRRVDFFFISNTGEVTFGRLVCRAAHICSRVFYKK